MDSVPLTHASFIEQVKEAMRNVHGECDQPIEEQVMVFSGNRAGQYQVAMFGYRNDISKHDFEIVSDSAAERLVSVHYDMKMRGHKEKAVGALVLVIKFANESHGTKRKTIVATAQVPDSITTAATTPVKRLAFVSTNDNTNNDDSSLSLWQRIINSIR